MKVYDLTQELFSAKVFPGDPVPHKNRLSCVADGDLCQLTELFLGSHSGTHMDAPCHFVAGGKGMSELDLKKCIGPCRLVEASGRLTAAQMETWLQNGTKRLLIKGDIEITEEAAKVMVEKDLWLVGVEGMTVGADDTIPAIHRLLLGHEIVIVESLRMSAVPAGEYFLSALPLKMEGLDGSPTRAVLVDQTAD